MRHSDFQLGKSGYHKRSPEGMQTMLTLPNINLCNSFTRSSTKRCVFYFSDYTVLSDAMLIRCAIDYVVYEQSEEVSHSTLIKCEQVKERLKKWGKAFTKDIKKQRNQYALKCSHEVCNHLAIVTLLMLNHASKLVHHNPQVTTADDPLNFMNSTKVLKRVEQLLEIAKARKRVWQEIFVVVAYLAAHIIFKNGQRPGVVQRMAINEWTQRVEEDKEWVIYVVERKTTGLLGPAKTFISNSVCSLMEQYFVHVRAKITPKYPTFQRTWVMNFPKLANI